MQRVFTLELRVDYRDKEKLELIRSIMARAAREVYGAAALMNDHIKPQVAIFSDDFFQTHEELALMHGADEAPQQVTPRSCSSMVAPQVAEPVKSSVETVQDESSFSPELLAALR